MYEIIAVTVAVVISVFNLIFICGVGKIVMEHAKVLSLLAKAVSLLTTLYDGLITPTDKEDKE